MMNRQMQLSERGTKYVQQGYQLVEPVLTPAVSFVVNNFATMCFAFAILVLTSSGAFAQESGTTGGIAPFSVSGFVEALGITGTLGTAMEAFAEYAAYIIGVILGLCVMVAILSMACRPAKGRAR